MRPPNLGSSACRKTFCRWCLPASSAGCALPAKTNWTGRAAAVQDARQPIGVAEDEVGALVAGEAAREADRQRVRIEQRAGGDHARRAAARPSIAVARALADELEQIACAALRALPRAPRPGSSSTFPDRRILVPLAPVGAQVAVEQRRQVAGIQVGTCTPLVIAPIGRLSSAARPARAAQTSRA